MRALLPCPHPRLSPAAEILPSVQQVRLRRSVDAREGSTRATLRVNDARISVVECWSARREPRSGHAGEPNAHHMDGWQEPAPTTDMETSGAGASSWDSGRRAPRRRPGTLRARRRPSRSLARPPLQSAKMHDTPLPDLFMYGRPGCHLCDDSLALLEAILDERRSAGRPVPAVVHRDITTEPGLGACILRDDSGPRTRCPPPRPGAERRQDPASPGRRPRRAGGPGDGERLTSWPAPTSHSSWPWRPASSASCRRASCRSSRRTSAR